MYDINKHGAADYRSWIQIPPSLSGMITTTDDPEGPKNELFAKFVFDVSSYQTTVVDTLYSRLVQKSGDDTYIMQAPPGSLTSDPVWRIQKIDVNGSRYWADGNTNFDNVADDYATLTYTL